MKFTQPDHDLREFNPNHEPAGSPAGGEFASKGGEADHPAITAYLQRWPGHEPELRAFAAKYGAKRAAQDAETFGAEKSGIGKGIPSYEFQTQVQQAAQQRASKERRAAKKAAGAARQPAIAEQLLAKHGLKAGDEVFDTQTGQPGVVKFDVKGQPYVHTRDYGNVLVGARWKKK